MSELISISAFNSLRLSQTGETVNAILELNGELAERGLTFTPAQAADLADTRHRSLVDSERLELGGGGAVVKLIKKFSDSQYVHPDNFHAVINDLTEIFFYVKSETMDKVHDEVLIDTLFDYFENHCEGDTSLLGGRELDSLLRSFRLGRISDRRKAYHRGENAPFRLSREQDYSKLDRFNEDGEYVIDEEKDDYYDE